MNQEKTQKPTTYVKLKTLEEANKLELHSDPISFLQYLLEKLFSLEEFKDIKYFKEISDIFKNSPDEVEKMLEGTEIWGAFDWFFKECQGMWFKEDSPITDGIAFYIMYRHIREHSKKDTVAYCRECRSFVVPKAKHKHRYLKMDANRYEKAKYDEEYANAKLYMKEKMGLIVGNLCMVPYFNRFHIEPNNYGPLELHIQDEEHCQPPKEFKEPPVEIPEVDEENYPQEARGLLNEPLHCFTADKYGEPTDFLGFGMGNMWERDRKDNSTKVNFSITALEAQTVHEWRKRKCNPQWVKELMIKSMDHQLIDASIIAPMFGHAYQWLDENRYKLSNKLGDAYNRIKDLVDKNYQLETKYTNLCREFHNKNYRNL
jgi:hypothetical protein